MPDQKNFVIAIVLSLVILLGFQYFYELPRMHAQKAAEEAQQAEPAQQKPPTARPGPSGSVPSGTVPGVSVPGAAQTPAALDRATILKSQARVRIESPRVTGSIALEGARLDDVTLATYHETTDPKSPPITLLNPAGTPDAYYAESGWVPEDRGVLVPTAETRWTADR